MITREPDWPRRVNCAGDFRILVDSRLDLLRAKYRYLAWESVDDQPGVPQGIRLGSHPGRHVRPIDRREGANELESGFAFSRQWERHVVRLHRPQDSSRLAPSVSTGSSAISQRSSPL